MKKTGSSDQRGAVMVEAAIYFPITIAIVMVVIYFGLFKMQESYFFFQVERAALEIARETAYPGYDSFTPETPMTNTRVDFGWEEGPSENQVKQYFASYKGTASNISLGSGWQSKKENLRLSGGFAKKQRHVFPGEDRSLCGSGELAA